MGLFAPVIFFVITFSIGIVTLVASNLIGIAWFEWSPADMDPNVLSGPKEVGYVMALNWSVSSIFLLPLAGTLVILALRELATVPENLVSRRMIVSKDLSPVELDDARVQKLWRDLRWLAISLVCFFNILVLGFALIDYWQVVAQVYSNPELAKNLNSVGPNAIRLDHFSFERDWSIAAHLTASDGESRQPVLNQLFAFFVYVLYAGLGVGLMFSFFFVVLVVGVFFMPGVTSYYGLALIPDLTSNDVRRGFESFGPFFAYAVSISAICFCLCYLMTLQNIYLRTPDRTLLEFVFTPLKTGLLLPAAKLFEFLQPIAAALGLDLDWIKDETGLPPMSEVVGFTFSKNTPAGAIQAVLAWVISVFIAVVLVGITYVFLRYSAISGRQLVQTELDANGLSRLRNLFDGDEQELRAHLETMKTWPLSWPQLNHAIIWSLLIILSLVFYRLGLLFAGAAVVFVVSRALKDILLSARS